MAKQTFTTGQVLTAAQMTSLQQTAMGGGAATAKTANYVLVAADAGTTVAMNAAGATTITVNTGLFAAGDTVFIQNLGAGACTVTAGTATVATAGSLILPQNDAGILYFVSTSSSVFYDFIQVGATSPLTTKGDLYTFSTSDTRLGVGANGTTLVADSAEATGLKWATPSGSAPASAQTSVATYESTSSVTYTGFTTATAATLTTGTKALVFIGCEQMNNNGSEEATYLSFAVSGATTSAATDLRGMTLFTSSSNRPKIGGSRAFLMTGLTAGSNTFTMQIKVSASSGGAQNRSITVVDMGS